MNTLKNNFRLVTAVMICAVFCSQSGISQEKIVYKTIDSVSLSMEIYTPKPEQGDQPEKYPAIVFFFGGGWNIGDIAQFRPHAKYFAGRGMVSVLVEYRVLSRNRSTPFQSLEDAKSAIRFLRSNAERFHINPDQIVASGGSAGGQLAAAAATTQKYNDKNDNVSISAKPDALVLFNPVIDNGPGGYGYDRIGEEYLYFSPLHNLRRGTPPTIVFLGTRDEVIPVETVKYYKKVMEKTGSRCDLYLYNGQKHGFFNFKHPKYYKKTLLKADEFLVSIGFLKGSPAILDQ